MPSLCKADAKKDRWREHQTRIWRGVRKVNPNRNASYLATARKSSLKSEFRHFFLILFCHSIKEGRFSLFSCHKPSQNAEKNEKIKGENCAFWKETRTARGAQWLETLVLNRLETLVRKFYGTSKWPPEAILCCS